MNRTLGWALLVAAFAAAAWLDPWSFSERDPGALAGSARSAVLHTQGVLLAMAFLQLLVSHFLTPELSHRRGAIAARRLTAAGAVLYAGGYLLLLSSPAGGALVVGGALLNVLGFTALCQVSRDAGCPLPVRVALLAVVFGMGLDTLVGLWQLRPELFPAYLGQEDGVRLRMLRLARVAAVALSILAVLYRDLAGRASATRLVRWGEWSLAGGAVGMPIVLTLAAFGPLPLKYLLPLPADAVLFGSGVALWLSFRRADWPESCGWLLVLASMSAGLLMGGYAFEGPLPAPHGMTHYNDFPRRLVRLAHAYAIVLGLLALFTRRSTTAPSGRGARRGAFALLIAAAVVTPGAMIGAAAGLLPAAALAAGPALAALAAALPAVESVRRRFRSGNARQETSREK